MNNLEDSTGILESVKRILNSGNVNNSRKKEGIFFSNEDRKFVSKNEEYKYSEDSRLYLVSYEDAAIRTETQKTYDSLMQIFELGGVKSLNNKLPTETNFWEEFENKTNISIDFYGGRFFHSDNSFYGVPNVTPISLDQFLTYIRLPKKVLKKEINDKFDLFNPNRASKGGFQLK